RLQGRWKVVAHARNHLQPRAVDVLRRVDSCCQWHQRIGGTVDHQRWYADTREHLAPVAGSEDCKKLPRGTRRMISTLCDASELLMQHLRVARISGTADDAEDLHQGGGHGIHVVGAGG